MIFPSEFIVHVLLPFALPITLISTIISFIYEPLTTAVILITATTIVLLYSLNVYRRVVLETGTGTKVKLNEVKITVFSFLQLEFALLMGAVKLFLYGSNYKWEQISDTRTKIEVEKI